MPVIIPAVIAAAGLIGGAIQRSKARKAEQKLEAQAAAQKTNPSITDFYNKSLSKYNQDPYQSQFYKQAEQNAGRATATGLGALQSRRSAVGGVSALVQQQNDSLRNAGVYAEQQQGQNLNRLGQAAGIKTQEDRYPFELQYNLQAMKAGGYNQQANSYFNTGLSALGSTATAWQAGRSANRGNSGGQSWNYS